MMKLLDRYIAKSIILSTLMVASVVLGILFLLSVLGEFKNIGEGDYNFIQAIIYVLMRLPNQLYQFSPMLILLGSVIGLSILSTHRELAVMRASGFSVRQIGLSILYAALFLIIIIGLIGELIAPNWSYRAEIRKENAQNAGEAVITASGVWFHTDNNFIHVKHVVDRELLKGVTRYQFDDQRRLQVSYYAETMARDGDKWVMHNVVKTSFYRDRTRSERLPKADWDLKLNTNLLNIGLVDPTEMTLPKLVRFSNYLNENGLQASEYQYEFWQRVFKPLAALIMIFLAIPFVLGTFSASTMSFRLIVGILTGFGFFISNALLGQISIVYQMPPMLAALLPLLLFAIVGYYLCKQVLRN